MHPSLASRCQKHMAKCTNRCLPTPTGNTDELCLAEIQVLVGLCVATTSFFSAVGCNAGAGKEQKLQH